MGCPPIGVEFEINRLRVRNFLGKVEIGIEARWFLLRFSWLTLWCGLVFYLAWLGEGDIVILVLVFLV
jgi:hypothetical protein